MMMIFYIAFHTRVRAASGINYQLTFTWCSCIVHEEQTVDQTGKERYDEHGENLARDSFRAVRLPLVLTLSVADVREEAERVQKISVSRKSEKYIISINTKIFCDKHKKN